MPGVGRKSPDYFALTLADGAWGGSASSRLDMNLREDKGYSYGAFSVLQALQEGIWYGTAGVQTNKTRESVAEFDKELKGIGGAVPITEAEFADDHNRIVRGYAQGFESLGQIEDQVANLWADGLPMSALQGDYEQTAKVTREQAQAAAEKYAKPDKAIWLLVGDRVKIEPGVRELNLGEIVLLDAEGKPVSK